MQQRIAQISGIARPTRRVRAMMALAGNDTRKVQYLQDAIDGVEAIESLARLITESMHAVQTTDGRIDIREVAARVLGEMKRHPK